MPLRLRTRSLALYLFIYFLEIDHIISPGHILENSSAWCFFFRFIFQAPKMYFFKNAILTQGFLKSCAINSIVLNAQY